MKDIVIIILFKIHPKKIFNENLDFRYMYVKKKDLLFLHSKSMQLLLLQYRVQQHMPHSTCYIYSNKCFFCLNMITS